jgi:uncharacterized protein YjeT (DUF2065 family)
VTTLVVGFGLILVALGLLAWAFPRLPRRHRR